MKKFKTRKEILENPEFKVLAFQLIREMELLDDHVIEHKVEFFIERKLEQCKMQGV